jgi:hypothetical protein
VSTRDERHHGVMQDGFRWMSSCEKGALDEIFLSVSGGSGNKDRQLLAVDSRGVVKPGGTKVGRLVVRQAWHALMSWQAPQSGPLRLTIQSHVCAICAGWGDNEDDPYTGGACG